MMKRLSLFVALACLGFAVPVCAEGETSWTDPTAPVPTGSALESGDSYYLYNVGAGMFLTNGNSYLTEASFGSTGLVVKLVNTEGDSDASGWSLNVTSSYVTNWSGTLSNTYIYYDGTHYWVDLGSDDTTGKYGTDVMYFDIEAVDGSTNVYTIKGHAEDANYLGYDESTTIVAPALTDATSEDAQWLLVSSDDYSTYQAALSNYNSAVRTYLNNALTDALALGLSEETEFTSAVEVYETSGASQTEIDAATAALATLIQQNGTASGEVIVYDGNCYRVTGKNLITNPSFEYGYTGWTSADGFTTSGTANTTNTTTIKSDYFTLYNDGGAKDGDFYLYGIGESKSGGASSAYALGTAWTLEEGKTYYFGYEAKALSSTTTAQTWGYTSLTNTLGTETSYLIQNPAISDDWTQVGKVFTNGTGEDAYTYLQIDFRWMGEYYLDDFVLCEVEQLQEEDEDVTSTYIKNPNGDVSDTSSEDFGWTTGDGYYTSNTGTGFALQSSNAFTDSAPFFEAWHSQGNGGTLPNYTLSQKISLPAGEYRLTADAFATRQDETLDKVSGVYLFAGGEQTNVYASSSDPVNYSVDFAVAEDNTEVEVGLKTVSTDANWVGVDNFKLYSLGDEQTYAIVALAKLISEATDLVAENGNGADDLQAAIDEAQAVLSAAESTEALESAISSLKEAIELYKVKNAEETLLGVWVGNTGTYNGYISEHYDESDTSVESNGTTASGTIMTQTLTDLPEGTYEVVVYCAANYANHWDATTYVPDTPTGAYEGDEVVTITANGITQAVELGLYSAYNPDSQYNITGLDDIQVYTLTVVVDESGTINLSISVDVDGAVNWVLAATKSVTYVGELPTLEDLQDAIDAAEEAYVNVGEDAFQIPTDNEEAAAVATALETAEALVEEGEDATSAAILAAIQALDAAAEAFTEGIATFELNAPDDDQVFNIIMESTYQNAAGHALEFTTSTTQGGYDLRFNAELNANLANQIFTFTPVDDYEGVNAYNISFVDAEGTTHYVCTNYTLGTSGGNTSQIRTSTEQDSALVVVVKTTTTEGVWKLYNTEAGYNLGINPNGDDNHALFTNDKDTYCDMALAEAPSEIEWTLQAEYGMLVLPFAPTSDEIDGLTFYSTEAYETDPTLALTTVTTPEANTPYLVSGTQDTYTFAVTARTFDTEATAGWLTGAYASTSVPTDSYVLQNGTDGLAFYTVTDEDPITITPNHCYLTVSTNGTADAPAIVFFPSSGTPTAIEGVEADAAGSETIYDLSGRKVSKAQKGIYIVNGKKVVIK